MTQENKQIQQIFYRWLKLNNLFPLWRHNVIQQNYLPRFTNYLKTTSLDNLMACLVDCSFMLSETQQPLSLWLEASVKWDEFVENNIYIYTKKKMN